MKKEKLSTLGYIMNLMGISNSELSQHLHIDASLVSKWKTGARQLNKRSVYFNEIIDYILEYNENMSHQLIIDALIELFPHETFDDDISIEKHLRYALANENLIDIAPAHKKYFSNSKTTPVIIFNETLGHRKAIDNLLNYADSIIEPGNITFFDSQEFFWLLEDTSYSKKFTINIKKLLKKGFSATFILHYSSSKESFSKFFDSCSAILFHKNVDWYYCECYDESIINCSFFIINHAISLLNLSSQQINSSTMVFTDKNIIMEHEKIIDNTMNFCNPLFTNYNPLDVSQVISNVPDFRNKDCFYAFLPVPAFIAVDENLVKDILIDNNTNNHTITTVIKLNNAFRKITGIHYPKSTRNTVLIFQLEKMMSYINQVKFISDSLSHCCKKDIFINKNQYILEIRHLVKELEVNPKVKIILASEKDPIFLPSINCWCLRNNYMIQMNETGFRVCDESTVVNIASDALEKCIRKIPPQRKEKKSVIDILVKLINELENSI